MGCSGRQRRSPYAWAEMDCTALRAQEPMRKRPPPANGEDLGSHAAPFSLREDPADPTHCDYAWGGTARTGNARSHTSYIHASVLQGNYVNHEVPTKP